MTGATLSSVSHPYRTRIANGGCHYRTIIRGGVNRWTTATTRHTSTTALNMATRTNPGLIACTKTLPSLAITLAAGHRTRSHVHTNADRQSMMHRMAHQHTLSPTGALLLLDNFIQ